MAEAAHVPFMVVGGGIGGLAAALAVARTGRRVHLVEQAPTFTEIGAGIQLAPNATRILAGWGLLPAVEDVSVHPGRIHMLEVESGRHLSSLDLGEPFRRRYGAPYVVLHRGDLLSILLGACEDTGLVTLANERTVTDFRVGVASVDVTCADGSTYTCEAVVGADGLRSRARQLVSEDEPIPWRYVAYRGAVPMSDLNIDVDANDELVWIGPGKHFVQYPIRRGELYNQVAVFASDEYREGSEDWGTPEELDMHFSVACPKVRAALPYVKRDRWWAMYDREPIDNWTRGRVTLMGDAAHPMLQYLAQGACQAIEDAECLAGQLRAHGDDIDAAYHGYQAERIPRTAYVQRAARLWGDIWHSDGAVVPLRNRILTARAYDDYTDTDWLYRPVAG